jgi:hypothetical protein
LEFYFETTLGRRGVCATVVKAGGKEGERFG